MQLCVVVALGSACVISELKVLKVLKELTTFSHQFHVFLEHVSVEHVYAEFSFYRRE